MILVCLNFEILNKLRCFFPIIYMQQHRTFCSFSILENMAFVIKIYFNLLQINYNTKIFSTQIDNSNEKITKKY